LYSLKQASLAWWKTLSSSLKEMGYKQLLSNIGVFLYTDSKNNKIVLVVYIDNILFFGRNWSIVETLKAHITKFWECQDLRDVQEFLWIHIQKEGNKIYLDQIPYLEKIIQ
jgi:hypothetical protein